MAKLVQIALINQAHGIQGQVKIRSLTEKPETIFALPEITDAEGKRVFTLSKKGGNPPDFIASIIGITDRNAAELLKGTALFAPLAMLPKKSGSAFHLAELAGLEARLSNGDFYGMVVGVYNFGAGDIIELELIDKTVEMLPFTDDFVGEVNTDEGFIIIHPPEYLEAKE
jgi:16S rRNA processing protein RimM